MHTGVTDRGSIHFLVGNSRNPVQPPKGRCMRAGMKRAPHCCFRRDRLLVSSRFREYTGEDTINPHEPPIGSGGGSDTRRERFVTKLHQPITAGVAMLAASLLLSSPVFAVGNESPLPPAPVPSDTKDTKNGDKKSDAKKRSDRRKNDRRSEQEFLDGYQQAYALVQAGQYDAAIAAFKALGHDEHPDVANYIGFASRKLGNYDDAKLWYEKALASDPKHVRTWQYYGMWHLEQGNRLKAEDHLETIRLICGGPACSEYKSLQEAIDGNLSY
jgi:hypothetical protein